MVHLKKKVGLGIYCETTSKAAYFKHQPLQLEGQPPTKCLPARNIHCPLHNILSAKKKCNCMYFIIFFIAKSRCFLASSFKMIKLNWDKVE